METPTVGPFDFNHNLTEEQKAKLERLRVAYKTLHAEIETLPPGRYRSLAVTNLETSAMFANKTVTHEGPIAYGT